MTVRDIKFFPDLKRIAMIIRLHDNDAVQLNPPATYEFSKFWSNIYSSQLIIYDYEKNKVVDEVKNQITNLVNDFRSTPKINDVNYGEDSITITFALDCPSCQGAEPVTIKYNVRSLTWDVLN